MILLRLLITAYILLGHFLLGRRMKHNMLSILWESWRWATRASDNFGRVATRAYVLGVSHMGAGALRSASCLPSVCSKRFCCIIALLVAIAVANEIAVWVVLFRRRVDLSHSAILLFVI